MDMDMDMDMDMCVLLAGRARRVVCLALVALRRVLVRKAGAVVRATHESIHWYQLVVVYVLWLNRFGLHRCRGHLPRRRRGTCARAATSPTPRCCGRATSFRRSCRMRSRRFSTCSSGERRSGGAGMKSMREVQVSSTEQAEDAEGEPSEQIVAGVHIRP